MLYFQEKKEEEKRNNMTSQSVYQEPTVPEHPTTDNYSKGIFGERSGSCSNKKWLWIILAMFVILLVLIILVVIFVIPGYGFGSSGPEKIDEGVRQEIDNLFSSSGSRTSNEIPSPPPLPE